MALIKDRFGPARVDTFPIQMLTWDDGFQKADVPIVYTMPTRDNEFEEYLKHEILPREPPQRNPITGRLPSYGSRDGFSLRYAT